MQCTEHSHVYDVDAAGSRRGCLLRGRAPPLLLPCRWNGYLASLPKDIPGSPLFWTPAQLAALAGTSVAARLGGRPAADGAASAASAASPAAAAGSAAVDPLAAGPGSLFAELPTQAAAPALPDFRGLHYVQSAC